MVMGMTRSHEEVIGRVSAERLWQQMQHLNYTSGAHIISQGDVVDDSSSAYVICSGEVVIQKDGLPLLENNAPMTRGYVAGGNSFVDCWLDLIVLYLYQTCIGQV